MDSLETNGCPICCDEIKKCDIVKCNKCENICCKNCFQQYMMVSELNPFCMHCKEPLKMDFIFLNVYRKWFIKEYKIFRENNLWKKEINFIQDIRTQKAAKAYMDAQEARYITKLNGELDRDTLYFYTYDLWKKEDRDRMMILNSVLCIEQYGRGWEDFDFKKGEARKIVSVISFPCPALNCHGVITNEQCNICGSTVCKNCREIIRNNSHKCDPNTVSSIQSILRQSHPCPKCATPISKISGCDQMFCTQCHTTFSWMTGAIITGSIHNPHYFDWLFDKNKLVYPERLDNKNMCEDFISYENLLSCFTDEEKRNMLNAQKILPSLINLQEELPDIPYYLIAFINLRESILNVRATSGNHVNINIPDNHDLRVKLLVNQISEENFKSKIEERDFEFKKSMLYWEIYSTVFEITKILFNNLFTYTHYNTKIKKKKKAYMYEIYNNIQIILHEANKKITYFDHVFGKDERLNCFESHPFIKNKNI